MKKNPIFIIEEEERVVRKRITRCILGDLPANINRLTVTTASSEDCRAAANCANRFTVIPASSNSRPKTVSGANNCPGASSYPKTITATARDINSTSSNASGRRSTTSFPRILTAKPRDINTHDSRNSTNNFPKTITTTARNINSKTYSASDFGAVTAIASSTKYDVSNGSAAPFPKILAANSSKTINHNSASYPKILSTNARSIKNDASSANSCTCTMTAVNANSRASTAFCTNRLTEAGICASFRPRLRSDSSVTPTRLCNSNNAISVATTIKSSALHPSHCSTALTTNYLSVISGISCSRRSKSTGDSTSSTFQSPVSIRPVQPTVAPTKPKLMKRLEKRKNRTIPTFFTRLLFDEYLESHYNYMLSKEGILLLKPTTMKKFGPSTSQRMSVVTWLNAIFETLQLDEVCFHLAIRIFDYSVIYRRFDKNLYDLVAISTLWIANKYYDSEYITTRRLCRLVTDKYRVKDVIRMEMNILKTIKYNLSAPPPSTFLGYILKKMKLENNSFIKYCSHFVMECFTFYPEYSYTRPSLLAISSVYIAMKMMKLDYNSLALLVKDCEMDEFRLALKNANEIVKMVSDKQFPYKDLVIKYSDGKRMGVSRHFTA